MNKVENFKDFLNEVFYDWEEHSFPRIKRSDNNFGFFWNKSSLSYKDGKYIFEYKMDRYEVDTLVFKKFEVFYSLLKEDREFTRLLDLLEHEWFSWENIHLVSKDNYIIINNVKVINSDNPKDIESEIGDQLYSNVHVGVNNELFKKVLLLYKMLIKE